MKTLLKYFPSVKKCGCLVNCNCQIAKTNYLIYFCIVVITSVSFGCITQKRRDKICVTCPTKETTIIQDSSWQKRYDSLLKIPVKGPIIILKDNPCADLCDSLGRVKNYQKTVVSETGIKGTIKGDKKTNTIIVDCGSKDSLQKLLNDARVENYHLKTTSITKDVHAKCNKEHRTWIDGFYKRGFWIELIILAFIIGIKFGPKLLKLLKFI